MSGRRNSCAQITTIDTADDLSSSSQPLNSKRRRSSLAQLTELLKDWGIRDKEKYKEKGKFYLTASFCGRRSALNYPRELILGYEVCQMKGTLIGVSELTLEKSYQFDLLRIRPLCFLSIR